MMIESLTNPKHGKIPGMMFHKIDNISTDIASRLIC
jgi:hypothetical protein